MDKLDPSLVFEELTGKENFRPKLESLREKLPWINSLKAKKIIIGGTNGKGECLFRLEQMLSLSGKSVLSFSSPHIVKVNERLRFNGELIEYQELYDLIEKYKEEARGLSYYEFLFYIFCQWAKKKEVDYILLEVGLGGRYDATNLMNCSLAIITSISRDHIEILGNSYREILGEKIEVTRKGGLLLTAFTLDYLNQKVAKYAAEKEVQWKKISFERDSSFSKRNTLLAYRAFELLEKGDEELLSRVSALSRGYDKKLWLGKEWAYFSGAHNIDGVRYSLKRLKDQGVKKIVASFTRRDKKELRHMVKMMQDLVGLKEVTLTSFDHFKAMPKEAIAALASETNAGFINHYKDLVFEDKTLYIGSIYYLGMLYSHFSIEEPSGSSQKV